MGSEDINFVLKCREISIKTNQDKQTMDKERQDGFTPKEDYLHVIKHSQIISLDMVITNPDGKILLGKRNNEPAKGTWFVPGGRVYKNETFKDACRRISKGELGEALSYDNEIGVYHHSYNNNFDNEDHGTHYLVFGVAINLDRHLELNTESMDDQHEELKWWYADELLSDPTVHAFTKSYFHPGAWNRAFM